MKVTLQIEDTKLLEYGAMLKALDVHLSSKGNQNVKLTKMLNELQDDIAEAMVNGISRDRLLQITGTAQSKTDESRAAFYLLCDRIKKGHFPAVTGRAFTKVEVEIVKQAIDVCKEEYPDKAETADEYFNTSIRSREITGI